MRAVFWKELTDYFGSWRFFILIFLICLVTLYATWAAAEAILDDVADAPTESVFIRIFTTGGTVPSFLEFIAFFGPFIGILFGFDA
ncbi:MAG: ABC transporter, partial [Planctomycetes bacterium]|nr:ABC transporter [Planctomycetota bacterium]